MIRTFTLSRMALVVLHFDAFSQSTKAGLVQAPAAASLEQLSTSLQSVAKQAEPTERNAWHSRQPASPGGSKNLR